MLTNFPFVYCNILVVLNSTLVLNIMYTILLYIKAVTYSIIYII